jgi:hypothetical protein
VVDAQLAEHVQRRRVTHVLGVDLEVGEAASPAV